MNMLHWTLEESLLKPPNFRHLSSSAQLSPPGPDGRDLGQCSSICSKTWKPGAWSMGLPLGFAQ